MVKSNNGSPGGHITLKVEGPVATARFISREKRFIVNARLKGRDIRAFLSHTGRLSEILTPDRRLVVVRQERPRRKLKWDVLAALLDSVPVVLDTRVPNDIACLALKSGYWPEIVNDGIVRREVTLKGSRFDFLAGARENTVVEVKSCTQAKQGLALFPDAPTERSRHQLETIMELLESGYRAWIIFLAMRPDVREFRPNQEVDPAFASGLEEASSAGVHIIAARMKLVDNSVALLGPLTVRLTVPS